MHLPCPYSVSNRQRLTSTCKQQFSIRARAKFRTVHLKNLRNTSHCSLVAVKMNVVDKVGRLIRLGVSSVHPFGGAVDIIVVEQQDGTYRSTPWYVQFGKFQGVLKGSEKIVTISVNGVEAYFHMYLDNSGQAHFLREIVLGSEDVDLNDQDSNDFGSFKSSDGDALASTFYEGNDLDNIEEEHPDVADDCKVDSDGCKLAHVSRDGQLFLDNPSASSGNCTDHLEHLNKVDNVVRSSDDSNSEVALMSVDGHFITAPISKDEKDTENLKLRTPQFHIGPGEASSEVCDSHSELFCNLDSSAYMDMGASEHQYKIIEEAKGVPVYQSEGDDIRYVDIDRVSEGACAGLSKEQDPFKSCLDLTACTEHTEGDDSQDVCLSVLGLEMKVESEDTLFSTDIPLDDGSEDADNNLRHCASIPLPTSDNLRIVDMPAVDMEIRDNRNKITDMPEPNDIPPTDHPCPSNSDLHYAGKSQAMNNMSEDSESKSLDIENSIDEDSGVLYVSSHSNIMDQKKACTLIPDMPAIEEECKKPNSSGSRRVSGCGFEISLCGNLLRPGMGHTSAKEAFEAHRISENEFKAYGHEIIKNGDLILRYEGGYYPWDKVAHIIVGITLFGAEYSVDPTNSIPVEHVEELVAVAKDREESHVIPLPTFFQRWRLWSLAFQRRMQETKSLTRSSSSSDEVFLDAESSFQSTFKEQTQSSSSNLSPRKNLLWTNVPTNEQISSLNLKDGQNTITFSFSTRVLGKQQVSAHIYLWKWNARIVISDVDGTITRSDVLGQVMPLVGKDWTHSGVASLFSAIKENGYQLLFLSARAIVQSDLTKRFLSNLTQDGKALPTGPVVISPDGLLPSFYREVVRRAPHEFKIACLEDIRSLFPSDHNPFYAGFGNRDTDELAYRKIGIPKGKIFIINPKGEVALYNSTDVKSYTTLHTLVNDIFPPTSLVEQEEYNSWNYWKLPPPSID